MLASNKKEKTPTAKTGANNNSNNQRASKKHFRRRSATRKNAAAGAANIHNGASPIAAAAVLTPNANRRIAGANWNATALSKNNHGNENSSNVSTSIDQHKQRSQHHAEHHNHLIKPTKYVAMDCEMVGIGFQGRDDMLARVSIVDEVGEVLLDKFVKPVEIITDYRTPVSGIRALDLKDGEEFSFVQNEVSNILKDRILVGHNVKKDLQVLHINHPYRHIRDTSNYKPLARLVSSAKTPSLKRLSAIILGDEIQTGEHNSIEDAVAAMKVYQKVAKEWEESLVKKHFRKH